MDQGVDGTDQPNPSPVVARIRRSNDEVVSKVTALRLALFWGRQSNADLAENRVGTGPSSPRWPTDMSGEVNRALRRLAKSAIELGSLALDLKIVTNHHLNQLFKSDLGFPSE